MSSRPSSLIVTDQYVSSPALHLPPPPPRLGEGPRPSGLRRDNVGRLPSLTTNLPPHSAHPSLLTPLSTSSLSSPFTQSQPAAHSASAVMGTRGVSPMALRASYNVPYNPSEWASGSRRASQSEGQSRPELDEGAVPPPPPYSPPRSQRTGSTIDSSTILSPAETHISQDVQTSPPVSADTGIASASTSIRDSGGSFLSSNAASPLNLPPPPPRGFAMDSRRPAILNRSRPVSVSALSQVMTHSSQHNQPPAEVISPDIVRAAQPPNAKRAASADDVSFREMSSSSREQSGSRSSSRTRGWHPGMPLPGPPPGLPPAASRSQSASEAPDDGRVVLAGPSSRPNLRRVPLRAPMLSPMPPTPADWIEEPPSRPAARTLIPLHIDTNISQRNQYQIVQPLSETAANPSPGPSTFSLSRSAAVRDSSAKGLRERRNLRRSTNDAELPRSLIVATNPWADAMASAASTTFSPTTFSDVPGHDESQLTSPVIERLSGGLPKKSFVSSPIESALTMSPEARLKRKSDSYTSQKHPKGLPTPPLSQKFPVSARSAPGSVHTNGNKIAEDFDEDSLQRHREFLARESSAKTDAERLHIFMDYMVAESVLRQKRYATAIQKDGIDLVALKSRLFDETDPAVQTPVPSQSTVNTPATGVSSLFTDEGLSRAENGWNKDYKPALSPIASMSHDEASSRGRTSSRWWESQGGSQADGTGQQKAHRSKRESKYMGLSAALMGSSIDERETPTTLDFAADLHDEEYPNEKANPERFGIYDEGEQPPYSGGKRPNSALLDISRFITLPPPYPRHYPAVNNCHPDLANYRLTVRSLSDLSEVKNRKARHLLQAEALRKEHKQKTAEARQQFKTSIQTQVMEGTITYAEAAEAEEALRQDEFQAEKEMLQGDFDTLQDVVIKPLHDLLSDRLVQLSSNIGELTEKLRAEAAHASRDRPQQEGDDTPELLEYLTQLKWLFETREQTHKEVFDLLTERNEKYKEIVLLPYRQANNSEKVRDTESFFSQDRIDRHKAHCVEALIRHKEFHETIEEHVTMGVQLQSSAFWDIAPSLLEVLQKMPDNIDELKHIAIPENEYLENPSYFRFPQQYLYTLLDHAEKSTYQFIEGQVNLHCLLHEVKSSLLLSQCREMECKSNTAAILQSPKTGTSPNTAQYRSKEEALLTNELKQKVGITDQQWLEGLGSKLQDMRERVKKYLEEQGVWEEMMEHAEE